MATYKGYRALINVEIGDSDDPDPSGSVEDVVGMIRQSLKYWPDCRVQSAWIVPAGEEVD